MVTDQQLTIVIADDHQIYLDSIRSVLSEHGFRIIGAAVNGNEAVRLCRELHPDVAILDVSMPKLNGIEAAREIAKIHPPTKIVILSMHTEISYVLESLRAGARAYVAKNKATSSLLQAISAVRDGGAFVSVPPDLTNCLAFWRSGDVDDDSGSSALAARGITARTNLVKKPVTANSDPIKVNDVTGSALQPPPVAHEIEVLAELFALLEQHAPSWYGCEQRNRLALALRLTSDVLVELCAVLEDYAPTWYTEAQRDRVLTAVRGLRLFEG